MSYNKNYKTSDAQVIRLALIAATQAKFWSNFQLIAFSYMTIWADKQLVYHAIYDDISNVLRVISDKPYLGAYVLRRLLEKTDCSLSCYLELNW